MHKKNYLHIPDKHKIFSVHFSMTHIKDLSPASLRQYGGNSPIEPTINPIKRKDDLTIILELSSCDLDAKVQTYLGMLQEVRILHCSVTNLCMY